MPLYESTFIARPDISSQQVDGLAEHFQEILRGAGGEVAKTEYWGLRSLAYRIKKNRKGHYYFMNIDAPPEAISAMERTMRINEDVIRYLTVRVDELDPNPAPLTQSRGGRGRGDSRSGGRGYGGRGYGGRGEGRGSGEGKGSEGEPDRGERRVATPADPDRPDEPGTVERPDAESPPGDGDAKEISDG